MLVQRSVFQLWFAITLHNQTTQRKSKFGWTFDVEMRFVLRHKTQIVKAVAYRGNLAPGSKDAISVPMCKL